MAFDEVFSGNGTRVVKTPVRSPRANSYAERFEGTLRGECLDHVLILGERNLRSVLAEYIRHYNGHRPHQALRQEPPLCEPGNAVDITARIERRQVLGGLISEYRRAALRARNARSAPMRGFWHSTGLFRNCSRSPGERLIAGQHRELHVPGRLFLKGIYLRPGEVRWPSAGASGWGFISEGGSTPYPHIALCATAPKLISSRRRRDAL